MTSRQAIKGRVNALVVAFESLRVFRHSVTRRLINQRAFKCNETLVTPLTGLPIITWQGAAPFPWRHSKCSIEWSQSIAQSLETWVYLISQTAC
jgi:hypothetical protein